MSERRTQRNKQLETAKETEFGSRRHKPQDDRDIEDHQCAGAIVWSFCVRIAIKRRLFGISYTHSYMLNDALCRWGHWSGHDGQIGVVTIGRRRQEPESMRPGIPISVKNMGFNFEIASLSFSVLCKYFVYMVWYGFCALICDGNWFRPNEVKVDCVRGFWFDLLCKWYNKKIKKIQALTIPILRYLYLKADLKICALQEWILQTLMTPS